MAPPLNLSQEILSQEHLNEKMDSENRPPNDATLPPPPPKKPPSLPYSRPNSKISKKIDFSPAGGSAMRSAENELRRESKREEGVAVKGWIDQNSPKKRSFPLEVVASVPSVGSKQDFPHPKGEIEPIELNLAALPAFLTAYFVNISPVLHHSTISSTDLIMNLTKTEDLHLLRYNPLNPDNSKTIANKAIDLPQSLAILHSDRGCLSFKRLNLVHLSVEAGYESELEVFLEKLLAYVWKHDNCEEVRCNLLHREMEDGELMVEERMKEAFSKTGWRWKSLTNDKYTGTRSTVYGVKRDGEKHPAPSDL